MWGEKQLFFSPQIQPSDEYLVISISNPVFTKPQTPSLDHVSSIQKSQLHRFPFTNLARFPASQHCQSGAHDDLLLSLGTNTSISTRSTVSITVGPCRLPHAHIIQGVLYNGACIQNVGTHCMSRTCRWVHSLGRTCRWSLTACYSRSNSDMNFPRFSTPTVRLLPSTSFSASAITMSNKFSLHDIVSNSSSTFARITRFVNRRHLHKTTVDCDDNVHVIARRHVQTATNHLQEIVAFLPFRI